MKAVVLTKQQVDDVKTKLAKTPFGEYVILLDSFGVGYSIESTSRRGTDWANTELTVCSTPQGSTACAKMTFVIQGGAFKRFEIET